MGFIRQPIESIRSSFSQKKVSGQFSRETTSVFFMTCLCSPISITVSNSTSKPPSFLISLVMPMVISSPLCTKLRFQAINSGYRLRFLSHSILFYIRNISLSTMLSSLIGCLLTCYFGKLRASFIISLILMMQITQFAKLAAAEDLLIMYSKVKMGLSKRSGVLRAAFCSGLMLSISKVLRELMKREGLYIIFCTAPQSKSCLLFVTPIRIWTALVTSSVPGGGQVKDPNSIIALYDKQSTAA